MRRYVYILFPLKMSHLVHNYWHHITSQIGNVQGSKNYFIFSTTTTSQKLHFKDLSTHRIFGVSCFGLQNPSMCSLHKSFLTWGWTDFRGSVHLIKNGKVHPCTGCMAHGGSRGIALLFLDHGTRRGWGVSIMPWPLFTPGEDPVPIVQEAGCAPGPVWTGAENLASTRIWSPDRPAHSQSLYRLCYPAHPCTWMGKKLQLYFQQPLTEIQLFTQ
jgi:hypothetical protein